jgi:tetratricopeptide (TPR) repeat protein
VASALRLAPADAAVRGASRRILNRLGRPDLVEAMIGEGSTGIDQARLHFEEGNQLAAAGEFEEAAVEFRSAVKLGLQGPRVYANLGAALASVGQYQQAIDAFTEALRLDPNLVEVQRNLALARELMAEDGGK